MSSDDIKLIIITFLGVLILVVFTMLAPVYVMPDNTSERHWRWNAPVKKVARRYDNMSADEIRSFTDNPDRARILEAMKNQPSEIPHDYYYVGPVGEAGFNVLGYFTILCAVGWALFVGYKVTRVVLQKVEENREPVKKVQLPYDVRRKDDRRGRKSSGRY